MCRGVQLPLDEGAVGGCCFGVVRHAERADGPFVTVAGERWTRTSDYARWPHDPPLSDEGIAGACRLAEQVLRFCQESGSQVDAIVTSPYLRCIETAAEICNRLGPNVRMLVDNSLGEIYGPSVMGAAEPMDAVRPLMETPVVCSDPHRAPPEVVGEWPAWPEDARAARQRFAGRFLQYMHWFSQERQNFLLVTHADAVKAMLAVLPSHAEQAVESVNYGGGFLAASRRRVVALAAGLNEPWRLPFLPPATGASTEEMCVKTQQLDGTSSSPTGEALDAWHIETMGMKLNRTGSTNGAAFARRAAALARRSGLSKERVLQLLSGLHGAVTLGTGDPFLRLQEQPQPLPMPIAVPNIRSRHKRNLVEMDSTVVFLGDLRRSSMLCRRQSLGLVRRGLLA